MNTGPKHKSYPPIGNETESPNSYGPSFNMLRQAARAKVVLREDEPYNSGSPKSFGREPHAGEELDFN